MLVQLPSAKAAAIDARLRSLIVEVTESSPETRLIDAYHAGYKLARESPTSRVLSRKNATSAYRDFMVISDAGMSLDDYIELVYVETEADFRLQQTLFYGENMLDARVLNVTKERTPEDPFLHFGVRYKKMSMPLNGVFEPRDTTYIEVRRTPFSPILSLSYLYRDAISVFSRGHRGVYCVRESMDFDEVPPFDDATRFYIKAIMVYTEAADGSVESVQLLQANPLGNMPALVFNKTAMNYSHISDDNARYLQQKRLLEHVAATKPVSLPRKSGACSSCAASFRGLRARHECWGCRDSMCGKCVVTIPRVLTLPDGNMKATPEEFCKRCFLQARTYRSSTSAASQRPPSDSAARDSHETQPSSENESQETSDDMGDDSSDEERALIATRDAEMGAQLTRLQLGIETQRQMVEKMRERLAAHSAVE
ncbi:hypothetical protein SPRG_16130 [Saprolegnia parasitica CBS 223.65]|uniref:FYVE-type domain-containing protein n=1 Tax=Saprolegnia parasitica (strain CBS 223.65) TaxID=695850 RepID=A0A067BJB3_SAPPC|nr:hypothetical protein SPRG_16130 [Saprolegnia parasitica CBS 223.65]KDO18524.1 hypothetical protein SPRG_16130 [Saprolegnia parasitica CBS 223.65]|eukprot:XP_012210770.1 hypothetical protein SPRG_16130 [Saprolegnia parasitica CBS 223.65]